MAPTADWRYCVSCSTEYQGEHDCSEAKVTIRPSTPMGWKCPECLQVWAPSVESCKNHRPETPADRFRRTVAFMDARSDESPSLEYALRNIGQP